MVKINGVSLKNNIDVPLQDLLIVRIHGNPKRMRKAMPVIQMQSLMFHMMVRLYQLKEKRIFIY